jgi:tetratricopeptide (TPR) repeat protein
MAALSVSKRNRLANNPTDDFFPRAARSNVRSSGELRRRPSRTRMPSSAGYFLAAFAAATALFFALWWMLVSGGDEAPWIPAGLAASVVLLVALSAREVVMRRAWTRYLLDQGSGPSTKTSSGTNDISGRSHSTSLISEAWRTIQKQSAEADAASSPESHFEVFHLCQDYLATTDDALRSSSLPAEKRIAIKAGQERVRALQKHHLLTWARDSSRFLTYEAQQRARASDKIESANRALHCLESALKFYPDETELNESSGAIRDFIASVKVAHWVELAERSAFKGHYRRAIERYKDALFYLNRETVKEEVRVPGAERIEREIELLQSLQQARKNEKAEAAKDERRTDQEEAPK